MNYCMQWSMASGSQRLFYLNNREWKFPWMRSLIYDHRRRFMEKLRTLFVLARGKIPESFQGWNKFEKFQRWLSVRTSPQSWTGENFLFFLLFCCSTLKRPPTPTVGSCSDFFTHCVQDWNYVFMIRFIFRHSRAYAQARTQSNNVKAWARDSSAM